MDKISLIGAAFGWGAQIKETEKGAEALREFGLMEHLQSVGLPVFWQETVIPDIRCVDTAMERHEDALPYVIEYNTRLAEAVKRSLDAGEMPVVLGGDHSIAIGTWSGVTATRKAEQNFGLIWIDAHMDAHTLDTTPSGAIHGMPVAHLLGHGNEQLAKIASGKSKINPKHLVMIGIRSYEPEEEKLLSELGIRVITAEDTLKNGVNWAIDEALKIAATDTDGFGVSIDLDAFDPDEVPGTGSPEPNGLTSQDMLPALAKIARHPKLDALEIVEYNPDIDTNHKTAALIQNMLQVMLQAYNNPAYQRN